MEKNPWRFIFILYVTTILLTFLGLGLGLYLSVYECRSGRSELLKKVDAMELQQEMMETSLKHLLENQVPVDFIYIQLPNQSPPNMIWRAFTWLEVTKDYAGLFFRAEGNESLPFGSNQGDNTRRISQMQYHQVNTPPYFSYLQNITSSGWSDYGFVGWHKFGGWSEGLRFYTTSDEVRPRNTTIRIWKRLV